MRVPSAQPSSPPPSPPKGTPADFKKKLIAKGKQVEVLLPKRSTLRPRVLRSQSERPLLYQRLLARRTILRPTSPAKRKISPSAPDRMPTSEDDAIGEPDPEFVDTKPHASTAGPDNSLRSTTPRNTRKSKRPRVHSPLVKDEEPPVPRGPAVDEHALFGPSHPDALSLQDAPVLPSLNESTVRYVYSSFILILLTFSS